MSMHFIPSDDLPEPIRQIIERQMDVHQMAHAARHHEVFTLFDELNAEQIKTLGGIFHIVSQTGGDAIAHWLEGIATTYLRLKHDTCMGCGSSHTPNFDEETTSQDTPPAETNSEPSATDPIVTPEREQLADKYNLYGAPHPVTGEMAYACRGCGQQYPSLEDRMLRKPDDCPGCHQKAKWG